MADKLRFAPEVEHDVHAAYSWLETQRAGLGEEFLTCFEARVQSLSRSPAFHECAYKGFRRALLRRFPYQIFYEFENEEVTIYCLFHTSRDPQKWKAILDDRGM